MMLLHEYAERAPTQRVTPTAKQVDQMETAQSWLIVNAPFFADISYRKLPIIYTHDVPIAATDHFSTMINPERFFAYELREQVFILGHEVMHYVYGDVLMMHKWRKSGEVFVRPGLILPYNDDMMGKAEDYRINAMLIASNVGKYNPDWLYDAKLSEKGFESNIDVYEKLYQECQKNGGKPRDGAKQDHRPSGMGKPGQGPAQFDQHLAPGQATGQNADQAADRSSDAERQVAIAQAMQAAEAMGQMPAGLKRQVGDILDPKVDWQDKIRATLFRRLFGDGYDWTMPDRRMIVRDRCGPFQPIYFARNTNYGCGTLVIGVDTSGSIGMKMVTRFFAEMQGIVAAVNPEKLVVLWCDARVDRTDELEEVEDLAGLKATIDKEGIPGGGGTDFRPVFTDIEKLGLEPECLVYFTDLMGKFPTQAPPYPVIWGSVLKGKTAPFGDTVFVEV